MPRPSRLEPYREVIVQWSAAGYPAATIRQKLADEHGVTVPESTWFDFYRRHIAPAGLDEADRPEPVPVPSAQATVPMRLDALSAVIASAVDACTDRCAQVIEAFQHLQAASATHATHVTAVLHTLDPGRLTDTLARHTAAFEALLTRLEATARWRARLRMACGMGLLTGLGWGLGLWYAGWLGPLKLPWSLPWRVPWW